MEILSNIFDLYSLFRMFIYYTILRFIYFIYKNFIRKRLDLLNRYGKGSWALVTGATDGIGKAICKQLAGEGFNIILVSRTLSKLNSVASELKKVNPNIQTHVIEFDFHSRNKLEDYVQVFEKLQDKFDLSILVNNVGTEQHNTFDRVKLDLLFSCVNLNVIPQVALTRLFINKIKSRKDRSAIITLSSFAGEMPFPMKSLYAATKAFNHYLQVALCEENSLDSRIDWLSVKPLEVETVLSHTKADGVIVITPDECASSIINDLGYEKETYTHWKHKIQAFIVLTLLPQSLLHFVYTRFWFKWFIKRDEKTE